MRTQVEIRKTRLAKLLKSRRHDLDLSQRGMATRLGFRQATLSQWESEKAEPDVASLEKIAQFCGYNMEEFWAYLNGDDSQKFERWDLRQVLQAIDNMPINDLAQIVSIAAQKLAQAS